MAGPRPPPRQPSSKMWLLPVTAALWALTGYAVFRNPQAPSRWRGLSFGGGAPRRLEDAFAHEAWRCESPGFADVCRDEAEREKERVCGAWEAAPTETWHNPSSGEEQQLEGKRYCCGAAYPSCAESGDPSPCCPDYTFHPTGHSMLVASSTGLYVSWITFFVLAGAAVCCAGCAFIAAGDDDDSQGAACAFGAGACGCFLLVALTCLFVWIGLMRAYWEGAWGEWNPKVNFESPKDKNLHEYVLGVSPTSFQAKCWPPLGGHPCKPECRNEDFVFDEGMGIVPSWKKWKMVDEEKPLRCMPPCDNNQLKEIMEKKLIRFTDGDNSDRLDDYSLTGQRYEVECSDDKVRSDVDEKGVLRTGETDTIECNPDKAGGLTGKWMVNMMCREPQPCQAQVMDGDGPEKEAADGSNGCDDGADSCDSFKTPKNRKAFLSVGNTSCTCLRKISIALDQNRELNDTAECLNAELGERHKYFFRCMLPAGNHGDTVELECEKDYHVTKDPNNPASAVCHDGKWMPGNTCILQIRGLESFMIMLVFWLTVVGMPSCCCVCTLCAAGKGCRDGLWGVDNRLAIRMLGLGCCTGICFWPLFGCAVFLLGVGLTTLPLLFFVGIVLFVSVIMWHYEPHSTAAEPEEEESGWFLYIIEVVLDYVVFPVLKWAALYFKWLIDLSFVIAGLQVYFPDLVIDIDWWNFPDLFPFYIVLPDLNIKIPGIPDVFKFVTWIFGWFKWLNFAKWASFYCDAAMVNLAALSMLNVAIVVTLINMVDAFGLLAAVQRRAEVRKSTFRVKLCTYPIPSRAIAGVFQGVATGLKYTISFSTQQMLLVGQRRIGDLYMLGAYGECPLAEGRLSKIYSQFLAALAIFCGVIIFLYVMNGHLNNTRLDLLFYRRAEKILRRCCVDPEDMGGEGKLLSESVAEAIGDVGEAKTRGEAKTQDEPTQTTSSTSAEGAPSSHIAAQPEKWRAYWNENVGHTWVGKLMESIFSELSLPLRPGTRFTRYCWCLLRFCKKPLDEKKEKDEFHENVAGLPFSFTHFVPVTFGVWTNYQFEAFIRIDAKKFDIQETWTMMAKSKSEIVALVWQVIPYVGITLAKLTEYMNESVVFTEVAEKTLQAAEYNEKDTTRDFYEPNPSPWRRRAVLFCKWAQWAMNVASYFNLFNTMLGWVSAQWGMSLQFWVFGFKVLLSEIMGKLLRSDHLEFKGLTKRPSPPPEGADAPDAL